MSNSETLFINKMESNTALMFPSVGLTIQLFVFICDVSWPLIMRKSYGGAQFQHDEREHCRFCRDHNGLKMSCFVIATLLFFISMSQCAYASAINR